MSNKRTKRLIISLVIIAISGVIASWILMNYRKNEWINNLMANNHSLYHQIDDQKQKVIERNLTIEEKDEEIRDLKSSLSSYKSQSQEYRDYSHQRVLINAEELWPDYNVSYYYVSNYYSVTAENSSGVEVAGYLPSLFTISAKRTDGTEEDYESIKKTAETTAEKHCEAISENCLETQYTRYIDDQDRDWFTDYGEIEDYADINAYALIDGKIYTVSFYILPSYICDDFGSCDFDSDYFSFYREVRMFLVLTLDDLDLGVTATDY